MTPPLSLNPGWEIHLSLIWPSASSYLGSSLSQCCQDHFRVLHMFKRIPTLHKPSIESTICSYQFLPCRPSLCQFQIIFILWSTLNMLLISCHWWGIHQGPPLMSLFPSTPTHYLGIRLRNHPVSWNLHALMEGLLVSDNRFTSLTSDRMVPQMFNINSFIHIH